MASTSTSVSATPNPKSFELTCFDWMIENHSSIFKDELMEDVLGHFVTAVSNPSVTAWRLHIPVWLPRAYEWVNKDLQDMAHVIQKLVDERQDPNHIAAVIVSSYHILLKPKNILVEPQTKVLQTSRQIDYVQFEAASIQFAEKTRMALDYISKSATDQTDAIGKEALLNLHHLAVHNTKQFENVEMWARLEEQARGRLEKKFEEEKAKNKADLESLRRDMITWKDQAEEMEATRQEAIKERQRFWATAYKLEKEALSLGEEVRTALR